MPTLYTVIRLDRNGPVAEVVLNNPDRLNAMSPAFFNEINAVFDEIDNDDALHVAILWAEGRMFTAGLDLKSATQGILNANANGSQATRNHTLYKHIRHIQDCISAPERCRKPVIAAVHGHCIGGGVDLTTASVNRRLDAGVGFVPEDRTEDGLVGEFTIAENLMLDRSSGAPFVRAGNIQRGVLADFAREKVKEFDIRTQGIDSKARQLSGGNQQKVVLARELSRDLRLLVAAQPTRGVDVGSIEFIHKRIVETRDAGVPVVVVSTELDEVTALADRIMVMYRGKVVGIVPGDTPRDVLGLMMAGEPPPSAGAPNPEGAAA